jgi:hypothetical protein
VFFFHKLIAEAEGLPGQQLFLIQREGRSRCSWRRRWIWLSHKSGRLPLQPLGKGLHVKIMRNHHLN